MERRRIAALQYALAACLSVAICVVLFQTWRGDLGLPWNASVNDYALYDATTYKGMVDNAWHSFNRYVGAPTGLDLRDYPMPDLLFLLWVKGASFFTKNPVVIANLTFVLTFPLITLPSLFVFRRLGVRYSIALVASLLFSFTSFHLMRGLQHVFYSVGACTVPLATLLALEVLTGKPLLLDEGSAWFRPRLALRSRGSLFAIVVAVVIGLSGTVYYPFFSSFAILVCGVVGAIRQRARMPLVRAVAIVGIVGAMFAAIMAPSLLYFRAHGKTQVLERSPGEAEVYGLKITQLLFPMTGHRLEPFRRFKANYDISAPLVNENRTAYLGVVGGLGFLYLTFSLLTAASPRKKNESDEREPPTDHAADPEVMHGLRALNLATVLLGTIAGFGAIFAFVITPQIRGYNRISVYVAFFCLAALAILAERAARRAKRPTLVTRALPVVLAAVLALGLVDQSQPDIPDYEALKKEYLDEDQFVKAIEASLPADSSIFQLPYAPFPENGPVHGLADYALFRPYLHSKTLRWSYGTMRMRRGDEWNKNMAARRVPDMIDALAEAGVAGIHVSRDGFGDHAAALEGSLASVLGEPAFVSPSGGESFFSLAKAAAELRARLGDEAFVRIGEELRTPLYLGWLEGFYGVESDKDARWIWCRAKGRFVIDNPSTRTRKVTFDATVLAPGGRATIRIDGDLFHEEIHADAAGHHLVVTVDVAPGEHLFDVKTDGPPTASGTDPRELYVLMREPRVFTAGSAPVER